MATAALGLAVLLSGCHAEPRLQSASDKSAPEQSTAASSEAGSTVAESTAVGSTASGPTAAGSTTAAATAAGSAESVPAGSTPAEPTATDSAPTVGGTGAGAFPSITTTSFPDFPSSAAEPTDGVAALAVLNSLAVKGRAPKTGYQRALFGDAWIDDVTVNGGHNGCRTREDILRRDLTDLQLKPGTRGCAVLTGVLLDPYTGKSINFLRGQDTSALIQIDHVVALSDSWQKGAQQLSQIQRENLANDPLNLLAVDGSANQSKGAGDAATWLPANVAVRCEYVARQIAVKARYQLWVTAAEKDAIVGILESCPGQTLPTDAEVAVPVLSG